MGLISSFFSATTQEAHTGVHIKARLQEVFEEFKVAEKIAAVTTDNGSNVTNAVLQELGATHMPCVAHTINLAVNDAIFKPSAAAVVPGAIMAQFVTLIEKGLSVPAL